MLVGADRPIKPVVDFFARCGKEVALLVPTQNGLDKSILDATDNVRRAFEAENFHHYRKQQLGKDGKRIVAASFVRETTVEKTKASLYRPETKNGDPRIWFYGLQNYAQPGNVLAIVVSNDQLVVINTSDEVTWTSFTSGQGPIGELGLQVTGELRPNESELLHNLREISAAGYHPTVTAGPTGVGMTLEYLLGIPANSSRKPDFKGIEIKSKRRQVSSKKQGLQTLFSKTPNWRRSQVGTAANLLKRHGYDSDGRQQLYCTISAAQARNGMGFWLEADQDADNLYCARGKEEERERLLLWEMEVLQESFRAKHGNTMWVDADVRKDANGEQFLYHQATLTRAPTVSQLPLRLADGTVTLDLTLSERAPGGVRDHGYLFRCRSEELDLLFPSPIVFDLGKD